MSGGRGGEGAEASPYWPRARSRARGSGTGGSGRWRPSRLLVPAMLLALSASCGIDSGVYQYEPPYLRISGNNAFILEHNVSANDLEGFKGYDLYYRFFDTQEGANAAASAIAASGSGSGATPQAAISAMLSRGFNRMVAATGARVPIDENYPVLSVGTRGAVATFTISMSQTEDWTFTDSQDLETAHILLRGATSSDQTDSLAISGIEPLPGAAATYDYAAEGRLAHPLYVAVVGIAKASSLSSVFETVESLPSTALIVELPL